MRPFSTVAERTPPSLAVTSTGQLYAFGLNDWLRILV